MKVPNGEVRIRSKAAVSHGRAAARLESAPDSTADARIARWLSRLGGAVSIAATWEALTGELRHYGAAQVSYAFGTTLSEVRYLSTMPETWRKRYAERGYVRADPIVAHVMHHLEPIFVDITAWRNREGGSARLRELAASLGALDIVSAFVVPLRGRREAAYGSIVLLSDLKANAFDEKLQGNHAHVIAICWAAHVRFVMLHDVEGQPPMTRLTRREREVYRLLAAGFAPDAIAVRLGIGRRTVDLHFRTGREHLGAATREEALAQAILTGEVQL